MEGREWTRIAVVRVGNVGMPTLATATNRYMSRNSRASAVSVLSVKLQRVAVRALVQVCGYRHS